MNAPVARIGAITKELRVKWLQTRETWSDSRSAEFDARYMQELFASVDRTIEVISELDKLITRIKKDCE